MLTENHGVHKLAEHSEVLARVEVPLLTPGTGGHVARFTNRAVGVLRPIPPCAEFCSFDCLQLLFKRQSVCLQS